MDILVNTSHILWIKKYLLDQSQHVVVNGFISISILNTGLPQGCVLPPVLVTV